MRPEHIEKIFDLALSQITIDLIYSEATVSDRILYPDLIQNCYCERSILQISDNAMDVYCLNMSLR